MWSNPLLATEYFGELALEQQMSTRPEQASPAFVHYDVLGVPITMTTLEEAARAIEIWAKDDIGRFVCVRDVHGVMLAQTDTQFRSLHREAAMVTPDGMPLVWLGRRAGHRVARTCGPDLMAHILERSPQSGLRHFLYGGKPGVAQNLRARLEARFPGLVITHAHTPPFRCLYPDEIATLARTITHSGADVVWIGLSTPRQEALMQQLARRTGVTLIGVGAAYDFLSGAQRRAPLWMQHAGLEWAFRLVREPKRLWRRYLVLAPRFVWLILAGPRR